MDVPNIFFGMRVMVPPPLVRVQRTWVERVREVLAMPAWQSTKLIPNPNMPDEGECLVDRTNAVIYVTGAGLDMIKRDPRIERTYL